MKAVNGHVAQIVQHWPALVDPKSLPFDEQEHFAAWLDKFLARLPEDPPLTERESQLAYAVARAAWRECWDRQAAEKAAEIDAGIEGREIEFRETIRVLRGRLAGDEAETLAADHGEAIGRLGAMREVR